MAVRGLGCPARFTLTAGQKGDAPQAAALLEGLPAEVVMADTAYDADHLRQAIAAKGALAVQLPALFEFGTGFLPPETGAPKRGLKAMSPRRDRKSETTTREKWPQKRLFC